MKRPLLAVCILFVTIMSLFSARGAPSGPPPEELEGREVIVTGEVYRKDTSCFYLKSVNLRDAAADLQQTISLKDNLICEYEAAAPKIGSTVILQGSFETFQSASNPGEFDAARYYGSQELLGRVKNISRMEWGEACSPWREGLFLLQNYFRTRLYQVFPEKEASIMTAMLLGDRSQLDAETKELYQENGIIHILSISGLHITLIGMSIYKLLRRMGLPIWAAAPVGAAVLLLYGVMTGMSVSACRAIGMYLIRMLGEMAGRTYDMLTAMGVMAALIVGDNPLQLQNAGFLLSFGAILGIGALYPVLSEDRGCKGRGGVGDSWKEKLLETAVRLGSSLQDSFLSGLSVTLMTLPILLWYYFEVPTYSVILNMLVLPFMSLVMLAGLLAMLIPGLGILGTVDCVILTGYQWLCEVFGDLPFSMWNPGRPEVWQIAAYYGVMAAAVWGNYFFKQRGSRGWLRAVLFLLSVGIFAIRFPVETTVTFLDVGQGDCICVQLDSGEVYLFDCGSTSRSQVGKYVLKPFLKYNGISRVDAVFVSHPDTDHVSGITQLLEEGEDWGISVGQLVLTEAEETLEKLELEEGRWEKPELLEVYVGDSWRAGGNTFTCLHPGQDTESADSNAASQCFYIEFAGGTTLLLTGDVEERGEKQLLAELERRGIADVTLLKVAHHGSKNSTGQELLAQLKPWAAVISCGEDNSYGHPHPETLKRLQEGGSQILTTPEYGAITVRIKGKEVEVYGFKESQRDDQ